jgi:secondary thiamine-phosphate synthase enzyme
MIHTEKFTFISEGTFFAVNVTEQVRTAIQNAGIQNGMALVYYCHTTGAAMIIEHEAGILVDLEDVLEKIVPTAYEYKHHMRGFDSNGSAHVRTALLNVSVTVPVVDGDLAIGTWQEILVIDMEPQGRPRTVMIQVMGE